MAACKDMTSIKRSWPWWRWIMTVLNTIALILSIILSWHYLSGGSMVGCGGGSPCDLVLNSKWSVIAGTIPISSLAVGVYLALLVTSFYIGQATEAPIRRMAWSVMLILAGSIAGSAIWFTILQKWFIGAFCPYCMSTHITGFVLSVLVMWRAIAESRKQFIINPLTAMGLSLIGLTLTVILAVSQFIFTPSVVYRGGDSHDKQPAMDYNAVPMVGSPKAPYVVTLLFDYQCPHCQKLHFILSEAINKYNGKLAFVLCPTPLNNRCNPYIPKESDAYKNSCELARIGLTVWLAKREAFPVFENWMFTFETGNNWQPRSPESTRAKAIELVGQDRFDKAWNDPWIDRFIQECVQIYGQTIENGKGGVPKLLFRSQWVIPEIYDADDLIMILQNSLGVPRP